MGSMFPTTQEEWDEYNYYKEYFSHPENVEKDKIYTEKCRRNRVGIKFYCSHTKEQVNAEIDRLSWEFAKTIANTDVTYLYKRQYPLQGEI
jgi:hypothetical protein